MSLCVADRLPRGPCRSRKQKAGSFSLRLRLSALRKSSLQGESSLRNLKTERTRLHRETTMQSPERDSRGRGLIRKAGFALCLAKFNGALDRE